jgi:hypothetical protein
LNLKPQGFAAATHTPFRADGEQRLGVVERQAKHLPRDGVYAAFIGGTTGERHSLTVSFAGDNPRFRGDRVTVGQAAFEASVSSDENRGRASTLGH